MGCVDLLQECSCSCLAAFEPSHPHLTDITVLFALFLQGTCPVLFSLIYLVSLFVSLSFSPSCQSPIQVGQTLRYGMGATVEPKEISHSQTTCEVVALAKCQVVEDLEMICKEEMEEEVIESGSGIEHSGKEEVTVARQVEVYEMR